MRHNTRLLASADLRLNKDGYSVGGGLRHVADVDASGDDRVSDQAFVNGSVDFWDGLVTLRGSLKFNTKPATVDQVVKVTVEAPAGQ